MLPRHQWRTKYLLAARRFPGLTIQASAKDTATIITDRSRAAVTRIATAVVSSSPASIPQGRLPAAFKSVTHFARSKMVVATPPPDACGSIKRSLSPTMAKDRLLLLPSQFGNVARSI